MNFYDSTSNIQRVLLLSTSVRPSIEPFLLQLRGRDVRDRNADDRNQRMAGSGTRPNTPDRRTPNIRKSNTADSQTCQGIAPGGTCSGLNVPLDDEALTDRSCRLRSCDGQPDDDGGAALWRTIDGNLTVVRLDQPFRGRQAETETA